MQGHLLCRMPLTSRGSQISVSLDYVMEPKSFAEGGGQGFCVYLLDPSVEGWDQKFDGTGPLGFVGKTGAIVGVGVDCAGIFCEGEPASIAIKRASDSQLLCKPVAVEGGVVTRKDEFWRKIYITFDIEANTCDVMIGGKKVLDDVFFTGVQIPRTVCVAVCAGTAEGRSNRICVNKLKLKDIDSSEKGRCLGAYVDWKVLGGKLVPSEKDEVWRSAGNAIIGSGFELTQDVDNQQVCTVYPIVKHCHS